MSDDIRNQLQGYAEKLRREKDDFEVAGIELTARSDADLVNDLEEYPHAYVLGCIMDRQIDAERAWAIPGRVRERYGSFRMDDLTELSLKETKDLFQEEPALHRFPEDMAECFYRAVQRIEAEYEGDASKIWAGDIGSARLVRRFLAFHGVGEKIATMAANILVRDFGVELSDYRYLDISSDIHVKRVFQRLGLVPKGAANVEVIWAAREMNPDYPGIFDFAVWKIGRQWCSPGKPNCPECVMRESCPSVERFYSEAKLSDSGVEAS